MPAQAQEELALEPVACTFEFIGRVGTLDELREGMGLKLPEMIGSALELPELEGGCFLHVRICGAVWFGWTAGACEHGRVKDWIDGLTGWSHGAAGDDDVPCPCPIEGGWRDAYRVTERPSKILPKSE